MTVPAEDPCQQVVREVLVEPLRAAGLAEPHWTGPFGVLWHADGFSEPRPVPASPIWKGLGCYDVTVARRPASESFGWDDDGQPVVVEPAPDAADRLTVDTEGSSLLDVEWTDDPDELRALLLPVAQRIGQVIVDDIVRFEADGGLPGSEYLDASEGSDEA